MEQVFTDANFEEKVIKSDKPTLVDFWAPWCGPCQMMGPIIEDLAKEVGDKFVVGKLNVDDNPEKAQQYGIMSIPSLKIFAGGKVVKEFSGVQTLDALKDALESVK